MERQMEHHEFKVGEIVQLEPQGEPLIYLGLQLNGRASVLRDDGHVEDHRIEDLLPYTPPGPVMVVVESN
jgi:hypothetical protein